MSSTITLRAAAPPGARVKDRGVPRRRSRWPRRCAAAAAIIVAMLAMMFSGGPLTATGTAAPAAANSLVPSIGPDLNSCSEVDELRVPNNGAWPGSIQLPWLGKAAPSVEKTFNNTVKDILAPYTNSFVPTGYEWWGTAGMTWTQLQVANLGSDCGLLDRILPQMGVYASNLLFSFTVTLGEIGLWVFSFLMGADAFSTFVDPIGAAVKNLNQALYANYLAPLLLISTLWMAWKGLVKRQSREAVTGAIWMIAATTAAAVFFINPDGLMKGINSLTQTITNSIIAASATIGSSAEAEGPARSESNPSNTTTGGLQTSTANNSLCSASGDGASTRISQCVMWYTFMYQPWAAGQFGPAATVTVTPTEDTTISKPGMSGDVPVSLMWLDATTYNHDEVINREAPHDKKQKQFFQVIDVMQCAEDGKDPETLYKDGMPTEEGAACFATTGHSALTGSDWTRKVQTSTLSFIALIVGMLPLVFLAGTLIVMQLAGVLLYLVAPLFLLLGVNPGFGRKMAMGWLEMLLANSLKRIGTAVLISGLLIILGAITATEAGWFSQVVLMAVASIAVMMFRKQFLQKISTVPLGGDGGGGMNQMGNHLNQRAKKMGSRGVGGTAAATAAGAYGGSAGDVVGAGLMGMMMGRAATPMIAARIGWNQGRRKGQQGAAEEALAGGQPGNGQGAGAGAVDTFVPRPDMPNAAPASPAPTSQDAAPDVLPDPTIMPPRYESVYGEDEFSPDDVVPNAQRPPGMRDPDFDLDIVDLWDSRKGEPGSEKFDEKLLNRYRKRVEDALTDGYPVTMVAESYGAEPLFDAMSGIYQEALDKIQPSHPVARFVNLPEAYVNTPGAEYQPATNLGQDASGDSQPVGDVPLMDTLEPWVLPEPGAETVGGAGEAPAGGGSTTQTAPAGGGSTTQTAPAGGGSTTQNPRENMNVEPAPQTAGGQSGGQQNAPRPDRQPTAPAPSGKPARPQRPTATPSPSPEPVDAVQVELPVAPVDPPALPSNVSGGRGPDVQPPGV